MGNCYHIADFLMKIPTKIVYSFISKLNKLETQIDY